MGLLNKIFGKKSKNEDPQDYYVSYQRSVVYEDGTKDAILVIDEEFDNVALEELIDRIEHNQKFLDLREDDVIDFSKDLTLTEFEYIIKDSLGNLAHNRGKNHEVAIAFRFLDDAAEWSRVFESIGEPVDKIDKSEINKYEAKLFDSYPKIMNQIAEGFGIDDNAASYVDPDKSDYYSVFKFKLDAPFFAYNHYLINLARKFGSFFIVTLNSEAELIQGYSEYGKLDEGLATGHDWEYLMEDYGKEIMDLVEDS